MPSEVSNAFPSNIDELEAIVRMRLALLAADIRTGQFDEELWRSRQQLDQLAAFLESKQDPQQMSLGVDLLNHLGSYAKVGELLTDASIYYLRALKLAKECFYKQSTVLSNLSIIETRLGNLEEAQIWLRQARRVLRSELPKIESPDFKSEHNRRKSELWEKYARLNLRRGDYGRSLKYCRLALSRAARTAETQQLFLTTNIRNTLAQACIEAAVKNSTSEKPFWLQKAIDSAQTCLRQARSNNDIETMAYAVGTLARVSLIEEDWEKAAIRYGTSAFLRRLSNSRLDDIDRKTVADEESAVINAIGSRFHSLYDMAVNDCLGRSTSIALYSTPTGTMTAFDPL
jgi:tetratricopeptide (TPR) repeat protein